LDLSSELENLVLEKKKEKGGGKVSARQSDGRDSIRLVLRLTLI